MHDMYELNELKERVLEELIEFGRRGTFSKSELPTIKDLAETGKDLCKIIAMCEEKTGYSYGGRDGYSNRRYSMTSTPDYYNPPYSMARRRDSMGRYSSDNDWMIETLEELKEKAPNDHMRKEFDEFIMRMERNK